MESKASQSRLCHAGPIVIDKSINQELHATGEFDYMSRDVDEVCPVNPVLTCRILYKSDLLVFDADGQEYLIVMECFSVFWL